jgi:tripartite-type tricarboxylate transporter receptor subunit TctC
MPLKPSTLRVASLLVAALGAGTFFALSPGARAEESAASFPSKPIHIIVGNAAGGGNDILARLVGQKLSEKLGQPVIIENRSGANSIIAAQYVAKMPPDGYVLLMGSIGMLTVNPAVTDNLPYDTARDFTPISMIASFPLLLTVPSQTPIHTVQELLDYAKANPAKANTGGSGSVFQVATQMFELRTGSQFQYITYRSTSDAMLALMRGDVVMSLGDSGPVSGPLNDGRVRALAITTAQRVPAWPNVPTMAEAGIKDMVVELWTGFVAPKGTPAPIVAKLQDAVIAIVKSDEIQTKMRALDVVPVGNTAAEFARIIAKELAQWADVAKAGNIKIQ